MTAEMTVYLIIGLMLGVIIGIIATNVMSSKVRKYNQVKRELDEAKQELVNQKQMIVTHFAHSAEILDNMANDFRRLYQHMAENSSYLLSEEDLKSALYTTPTIKMKHDESTLKVAKPPKDYSGNPSGLLKTEENKI